MEGSSVACAMIGRRKFLPTWTRQAQFDRRPNELEPNTKHKSTRPCRARRRLKSQNDAWMLGIGGEDVVVAGCKSYGRAADRWSDCQQ